MADYNSRLGDYVDVAARIAEFRQKHPDGSLQPADPAQPYRIETIGDRTYVVVVAAAYRSPDDTRPGIGMAYEAWPGRTPYTKDSELMNAETSAWGRAIVAVLAADTKRGIATADEVRNRQEDRRDPQRLAVIEHAIDAAEDESQLRQAFGLIGPAEDEGAISPDEARMLGARVRERKTQLAPEQPTLPAPTDNPPTDKQTRKMYALFRSLGIAGPDQHDFMTAVVSEGLPQQRVITSGKQLNANDVDVVILRLEQRERAAREVADATPAP